MRFRHITLALLIGAAATSCSTSKSVLPYFTDIATVSTGSFNAGQYSPEIKPDDELLITVTSLNPEATAIYNLLLYAK